MTNCLMKLKKGEAMKITFNIKSVIDSIKKVVDNIIDQIEENFGPKLKPVKIKSNKDRKRA